MIVMQITKEKLKNGYANTFSSNSTGKEYVTLEKNNSDDNAEFAIYGNRLVGWIVNRFRIHSNLSLTLDAHPKIVEFADLLEVGCGMGRLLKPLSVNLKWVTGVDISAEIIKEAAVYLRDIPNKSLYENDGTSLSIFADESFDYVLCTGVFQHIPYREVITNYLHETIRVLRTNGLFMFTFQVWQNNKTGEGRIGAKFSAEWLNSVFDNQPVKFVEITADPMDPIPHFVVLLKKIKTPFTKIDFLNQEVLKVAWRTECWKDLKSMKQHQILQEKGPRKITFYDSE